jgi:hypothetical protein
VFWSEVFDAVRTLVVVLWCHAGNFNEAILQDGQKRYMSKLAMKGRWHFGSFAFLYDNQSGKKSYVKRYGSVKYDL